jgi:heme/copper-type cytochrome/quinol oxidase subunit 2
VSTYSKARCAICGTLFHHENGTAPVCDDICYDAYLRHKADKLEAETKQQPNQQETEE